MKFKTDGAYCGNVIIPEGFIREDMKTLSEAELKLFLIAVMHAHSEKNIEWEQISEQSGYTMRQCVDAFQALEQKKLIRLTTTQITILSPTPDVSAGTITFKKYTPEEIYALDDEFTSIGTCAQTAFGKCLNEHDTQILASLYQNVGIPSPVLMILIEYIAAIGKKSMGYLKSVALDWHEKGIDTAKKAHDHITYLEQQKEYYASMRDTLGIFGREFTKKEKEYLDKWKEKFNADLIKEAYEKTLDSTGKISFAYMNKILTSDQSEPVTVQVPKKRVTPSKFSNFEPRKKDYDSVKEKARARAKKLAENL